MTHVYGYSHCSWCLVFQYMCISGSDHTPGAEVENLKSCHKYILIIVLLNKTNKKKSELYGVSAVCHSIEL